MAKLSNIDCIPSFCWHASNTCCSLFPGIETLSVLGGYLPFTNPALRITYKILAGILLESFSVDREPLDGRLHFFGGLVCAGAI